jgi:cell volume regulation protein A
VGTVAIFLLVVAAILIVGIVGEIVFTRTGIPDVVWLIAVGLFLGPLTQLVSRQDLSSVGPYFGAIVLIIVLFDGGSELALKELSLAAGRGTVLALVGFSLSVGFLAAACSGAVYLGLLPETWTWKHCILVGTILGGSSSVVIMPSLRKAGLSSRISNLVNLESALTDVLAVVSTGAFIALAQARGSASHAGQAGMLLGQSLGVGVGVGFVVGVLTVIMLRRLRQSGYAYPLILGLMMITYVIVDTLGGSAALAILVAAVMIGNAPTMSKMIGLAKTARLGQSIEGVHDEITFIIKSFFFVFLGAVIGPPWGLVGFGVVLGLLLWLARVPSVRLATIGKSYSKASRRLIGVLMPRGMAAGVLAIVPHQMGIPGTEHLPVLVFSAVCTTILLFSVSFPFLKKKLPAEDLAEAPPPVPAAVDTLSEVSTLPELSATETRPDVPADESRISVVPRPSESPAQ